MAKNRLLHKIVNCANVQKYFNDPKSDNPCKAIIESQNVKKDQLQVPEPWSGRLNKTPILFISSNPSISNKIKKVKSEYPRWKKWDNKKLEEYFTNRFEKWVKDGIYPLKKDGKPCDKWCRYWAAARARACELSENSKDCITPGEDYALTEIVHCKSAKEKGVKEASEECAKKYLDKILKVAQNVKVIVCIGKKASDIIRKKFGISDKKEVVSKKEIVGRNVYFTYLPHPNSHEGKKTFESTLCKSDFDKLKKALKKRPKQ